MKRTSFEAESRIVGEDFNNLIEREGGKSAGLHLLRRGIDYLIKKGKLDTPRPIGTAKWHSIPTRVYTQLESELHQQITEDNIHEIRYLLDRGTAKILTQTVNEAEKIFPGACKDSYGTIRAHMPKFHLRSSTTLCSFRDDQYFGTFLTKCGEPFFACGEGPYEGFIEGKNQIFELVLDFYIKKHFRKEIYGIGENEKLGMVLMPTQGQYGDRDAITYSSYPEDKNAPTLIETWVRKSLEGKAPLELIRSKNTQNFERIKMSLDNHADRRPLSNEDAETIYTLANAFQEELKYPVNLEIVVLKEGIIPVEIKPVPTLREEREIKQLSVVPANMQVVAETPFVAGSYRRTARLARPDYKNDYSGHAFEQPAIIWHTQDYKGHRFYNTDPNCIGILNPEEGAVLTHDSSLLPGYGRERDKFAFIGLPIIGFRKKLENILQERKEKTVRGKNSIFSYTPFPITIESDGRKGRVLVEKINAHHF